MSNPSLYHLTGELGDLEALFDQLDDTESASLVLEQFAAIAGEWEKKLEACCQYRANALAESDACANEAARLQARARACAARADRITAYMFDSLRALNQTKAHAGLFRLRIQGNGGRAPLLVDEQQIPEEFWVPGPFKLDRDKLRETLEAGESVPGARIGERGQRLVIE